MTKKNNILAVAFLFFLLIPVSALCEGYGFYSWSRSWPTVGVPGFLEDQLPALKDIEIELLYDHFTIGYLYDSADSPEDRFNWRFSFGIDVALARFEKMKGAENLTVTLLAYEELYSKLFDATGFGFNTKLACGYGLVRTDKLRVWIGPSVRINVNYFDPGASTVEINSVPVEIDPWGVNLSAGGGIEGGVTYQLFPRLTLDLSSGFLYNFFAYYQDSGFKFGSASFEDDHAFFYGQEPLVFVQLALLFKFGGEPDAGQ